MPSRLAGEPSHGQTAKIKAIFRHKAINKLQLTSLQRPLSKVVQWVDLTNELLMPLPHTRIHLISYSNCTSAVNTCILVHMCIAGPLSTLSLTRKFLGMDLSKPYGPKGWVNIGVGSSLPVYQLQLYDYV